MLKASYVVMPFLAAVMYPRALRTGGSPWFLSRRPNIDITAHLTVVASWISVAFKYDGHRKAS